MPKMNVQKWERGGPRQTTYYAFSSQGITKYLGKNAVFPSFEVGIFEMNFLQTASPELRNGLKEHKSNMHIYNNQTGRRRIT